MSRVCELCDREPDPGYTRCDVHLAEIPGENAAERLIDEAANRLESRAKDFEREAALQPSIARTERYGLIADVLREVAGQLRNPIAFALVAFALASSGCAFWPGSAMLASASDALEASTPSNHSEGAASPAATISEAIEMVIGEAVAS